MQNNIVEAVSLLRSPSTMIVVSSPLTLSPFSAAALVILFSSSFSNASCGGLPMCFPALSVKVEGLHVAFAHTLYFSCGLPQSHVSERQAPVWRLLVHGGKTSAVQHFNVGHFVTPVDFEDAAEALQVELLSLRSCWLHVVHISLPYRRVLRNSIANSKV